MRIADHIFKSLNEKGIDTCFLVTGGGSMFLNDALQKNNKIKKIFCHNEQSCAMAADAYYRLSKKPVIISSGGTSEKDLDDIVNFFNKRDIDLAVNHCISLYPSEDNELCLNEIDYLKERYPNNVIGFSTHEYHDWSSSILISYAKGARTWERHIDIQDDNIPVSKYCSKPDQIDAWFKSFYKAVEMCGPKSNQRRNISKKEIDYLNKLVTGIFAKKNLPKGYVFDSKNFNKDFYLAIPLLRGQLSCREILNGEILRKPILKDKPLLIDYINGPYFENIKLKKIIKSRGLKLKN